MDQSPRFRARPATAALIVICSLVFVAGWIAAGLRAQRPGLALFRGLWTADDAALLEGMGALAAVRVWLDSQWWRVLSAGFLHGSWLHLTLNMLGLWAVGQWTEKIWGPWKQLLVFVLASVGGCLASLAWAEAPLVVGASAGIFGIAGALVIARAYGRPEVVAAAEPVSARVLAFWLVFWLAIGAVLPIVFDISVLAQAGHVGGLVFGCLAGLALSAPRERRFVRGVCWGALGVGLLGLVVAGTEPAWRVNYDRFLGVEQLERGEYEAAVRHFERALDRSPDDVGLANDVAFSLAEGGLELDRAETLVRRAVEAEPDSPSYLDTLGWVLCRKGRVDEGVAALEDARAIAVESELDGVADRFGWLRPEAGGLVEEIDRHIRDCGLPE